MGKSPDGGCDPLHYKQALSPEDVEIADDMFLVKEPPPQSRAYAIINDAEGVPPTVVDALENYDIKAVHLGLSTRCSC